MLRGVRDRLLLSAIGLPDTDRLGDLMFSIAFGVGERLLDFERTDEFPSNASEISLDSFGFGDADAERSDASEFTDLLSSPESFNGDAERDLVSDTGLPDRELPLSCSLLSGLIGVSN